MAETKVNVKDPQKEQEEWWKSENKNPNLKHWGTTTFQADHTILQTASWTPCGQLQHN